MTISTDGQQMVWGLFNADGYECEDLLGVFHSEEEAMQIHYQIESLIRNFHEVYLKTEWRGSVTVRSLSLGEYDMPAAAQHMLKETNQ